MIGERNTPLKISSPSFSNPTFLGALCKTITDYVSHLKPISFPDRIYQLNYRLVPFEGGSDHLLFNDRYLGIPSVMFGHDDLYWHSSADTIDKVDPFECRSVGIIGAGLTYALSFCDYDFLNELVLRTYMHGIEQIIEYELDLNVRSDLTSNQIKKQVDLLENITLKQLKSITSIDFNHNITEKVNYFTKLIKSHFNKLRIGLLQLDTSSSTMIEKNDFLFMKFKRNYIGPLPYNKLLNKDRSENQKEFFDRISKAHWAGIPIEFLNLIDGNLTVNEIFLLLRIKYKNILLKDVLNLIQVFEEEGLIVRN